jgi:hypothetical protein
MLRTLIVILIIGLVAYVAFKWLARSKPKRSGGSRARHDETPTPRLAAESGMPSSFLFEYFLLPWLVERCRRSNSLLNAEQLAQVETSLRRILQGWRQDQNRSQQWVQSLHAVLALAIPDAPATRAALEVFLRLAVGLVYNYHADSSDSAADASKASASTSHDIDGAKTRVRKRPTPDSVTLAQDHRSSESRLSGELEQEFGCAAGRLSAIQDERVLRLLQNALRSEPSCPITLEPLVDPVTKKLDRDVAVLCQFEDVEGNRQPHVFLFRRSALEQWFAKGNGGAATINNPLTRKPVDQSREFFPLS